MKTINETLTPSCYPYLGHWQMWMNDVQRNLALLCVTPKPKIRVDYTPVEYISGNLQDWDCQHASTHPDTIDYYALEADNPVDYVVEQCDSCPAFYDPAIEEWIV